MLSIVIGVHHVWRHRRRADADDKDAVRHVPSPLPSPIPNLISEQSKYLRLRPHARHHHRSPGSLTPLACLLALPLAALLWAILSFTIAIATFCFVGANADVHARALLGTVLGVLVALAALTLLVFWDAWRERPTSEPEEDYARGVGVGRELAREGWVRNKVRRMKIARARVMDGIRVRVTRTKTAAGRTFSMGRTNDGKGSAEESTTGSV